jgi:hypothetical protein
MDTARCCHPTSQLTSCQCIRYHLVLLTFMITKTRKARDSGTVTFEPRPIADVVDERALEVLAALSRAWEIRQDTKAPRGDRTRATGLINQLWGAAQLAPRGPRRRFPPELVPLTYERFYRLAEDALEEYRDLAKEQPAAAKTQAIEMILNDLWPSTRHDPKAVSVRRENLKRTLEGWRWVGRRVDGLARDLTAFQLEITPGSVRVLKHRARQGMKGGRPVTRHKGRSG